MSRAINYPQGDGSNSDRFASLRLRETSSIFSSSSIQDNQGSFAQSISARLRRADTLMKRKRCVARFVKLAQLAGREGRGAIGADLPVAKCGLRVGVDTIGG
jgi:hypothetical protein